jgi:hypothetical protein
LDGAADANLPAIDPSLPFLQLTLSQEQELCDWENNALGGYGTTYQCPNSGIQVTTDTSQKSCVGAQFTPSCQVTVGQFEACIEYGIPTRGCDRSQSLCQQVQTCYQPVSDQ